MKKTLHILAALGFASWILCFFALGDTNTVAAVADATPYVGADTTGAVVAPFVSGLVIKFPWIMTILAVMGTARAVAKPLFSAIEAGLGPDNAFAKRLAAAESGPIYKSIVWLLDFFFSVKVHLVTPTKQ